MTKLFKLLFLLIFLSIQGCAESPPETLRLGTNVWPGYEPLYLARELGHLDADKVRLVEYTSTSQVLKAYRSGLLDAAALTMDEAIKLYSQGEEVQIVLVTDISNGADALVANKSISSIEDLRNSRIAVEQSALGAYFLKRILEVNNYNYADINIVSLDVNQHERAILENKVDAAVTFEPFKSKLLQSDHHVLFDSSQIPGEIVDVIIVRKSKLPAFKTTINYLKSSWFLALNKIQTEPNNHAALIDKRMKLGKENVLNVFEELHFPNKEQNAAMLDLKNKKNLLTAAQKMTEVMVEQKLLDSKIDASYLF
jgi:NitT/TauT family transport system substrate-binding protein